jgi:hypothetical protein
MGTISNRSDSDRPRYGPRTGPSAKSARPTGYNIMSPQPHEGPAEEGLSSSMLPVVSRPEQIECLRRMLSGFSHRCRNSLNGIKMSLYLFRRELKAPTPGCWKELEQMYLEIERFFDHLQTIYRPMALTMVRSPLGQLVADHEPDWRSWFQSSGRTLQVEPPRQDLPGDFDPIHLGMGLDAVVAWRAEARGVRHHPRLSWRIGDGFFEVCWDEAVTSCRPARPARGTGQSQGGRVSRRVDLLALPLLARIVAAHGGQVESTQQPAIGFGLKARWPQFQSPVLGARPGSQP